MRWEDGTKHSPANDNRLSSSIPTSYTFWQQDGVFYADSCFGTAIDYDGDNAMTVLHKALDALDPTYGGKISIKAGQFDLLARLDIDRHRVTIQGEGMGKTILKFTGSYSQFYDHVIAVSENAPTYPENIEIRDLTIDCNNKTLVGLHFTKHVVNGLIENVEIKNFYAGTTGEYDAETPASYATPYGGYTSCGILAAAWKGIEINNVWVHDGTMKSDFNGSACAGVWLTGIGGIPDLEETIVRDARIEDLTANTNRYWRGFHLDVNTMGFIVDGFTIRNVLGHDTSVGIEAGSAGAGTKGKNDIFTNGFIENCDYGIAVNCVDNADATNYFITDVLVQKCKRNGIETNGKYNHIQQCIIRNNGQDEVGAAYQIGVVLGSASRRNLIQNNFIYDDQDTPTQNTGIREYGDYNSIKLNLFYGNPTTILLSAGINDIIKDNQGYNPVGIITTPYPAATGNLVNESAAQAYPTSAAVYTAKLTPKTVIVGGGTISAIAIDGVTTGLTSGVFHLDVGQTIAVTWSVQPTINQVRAD